MTMQSCSIVCFVLVFLFGVSSFQFCLRDKQFWVLYLVCIILCKRCAASGFCLNPVPSTDVNRFGTSEHLVVEEKERQMS